MPQNNQKPRLLRKQAPMRRVLLATVPCIMGGVYFFGWQVLASVIFCSLVGFTTEYVFCRRRGEPATESVFVTAFLFALVMPPNVPWHVQLVGMVFAVLFSKEVFGGFGYNPFNPAIAGRCFVYVCFPVALTGTWPAPASLSFPGALGMWSTAASMPDAISSVTPMAVMKAQGVLPALGDLFFGNISGTAGVTSAMLIIIGGAYLFWTKTASRLIISTLIISYAVFNQTLTWIGVEGFYGALPALLGGGFLFGAFFMATDPVSGAKTPIGKFFFALIIATGTVVIRNYSIFNGGLMFSILLANMFGPIIDYSVKSYKASKAQQKQEAAA